MQPWLRVPLDWRRPEASRAYDLFWCPVDQFGLLHPRPTADETADFYAVDNYYTHSAEQAKAAAPSGLDRLRIRLAWQFDLGVEIDAAWFGRQHAAAPARVLDIGCGNGRILAALQAAGHTVLGVEPDEAARAAAVGRGLDVLPGTAEALPAALHGRQFDAVLLTHVLEHCSDPVQALRNAAALLAPGGRLTVETPNNAALGRRQAGLTWRWLDAPRHLNFFTPLSLQLACVEAGLRPVAVEFRGYTRQFQPDWIADEQLIWDRFHAAGVSEANLPARSSRQTAWLLLLRTLSQGPADKYDSVRVIATRSESEVS